MDITIDHLEQRAVAAGLTGIPTKVMAGERLSFEDGVAMYKTDDVTLLGLLANHVREQMHGDICYYNVNTHVNYTNYCNQMCDFCAFQRRPGDDGAYCMSPDQIENAVKTANPEATEVHMVAGVWPALGYPYFLDILRAAKRGRPDIHVKAFTMVEIDQIVRLAKKPVAEVLAELREAGLDSMPGGGAEIFAERVHEELYPRKLSSDNWVKLAKEIHNNGFKTNCTMMYGMIETIEERVDHLQRLRNLQDETGGFQTYIPLAFHPDNTKLEHLEKPSPTERLRSIAVGRLFLDNIPHIKAYWIMLGLEVAQAALTMGADDLDGTVSQEKIYHEAGASTPQQLTRADIHKLIREAGRRPVERNTVYDVIADFSDESDSFEKCTV
ncbi:MAG: aminofutalosine synthase MqnE [Planctomycetota bacterium]|nr:aminofutalosine synthase MqnE [Planctomycetota bacterium]